MSNYLFLFLEPHDAHRHTFSQWRCDLLPAHLFSPTTHTLYLDATESTAATTRSADANADSDAQGPALTTYNHLNIYRFSPATTAPQAPARDLELALQSLSSATQPNRIISYQWTTYTTISETHPPSVSPPAPTIVTVGMTVPLTDSAARDTLDRWYADEHIPALAGVPGWQEGTKRGNATAPFLAVHQWDEPNGLGGEVWRAACATPSTKMIEEMQVAPMQRRVWRPCLE
ncbi:hypothetical protein BJX64DRAFT_282085 [Aspergillus heterothallicus]